MLAHLAEGWLPDLLVPFAYLSLSLLAVLGQTSMGTENIAIEIWNLLAPKLAVGKLHRIRLHETPDLYVDYYGD